jgi:hypothetical protein
MKQIKFCILAAVIAAAFAAVVTYVVCECSFESYRRADQRYVDEAIRINYGSGVDANRLAKKSNIITVVRLPDLVCVGMMANKNTIGGDITTCFNERDGNLYMRYAGGE